MLTPRTLTLVAVLATGVAACAPATDRDASIPGENGSVAETAQRERFDLAVDDLAGALGLPVVALASADDTARVTVRDLEPRAEPRVLWIHWRRPGDGVFRVTREDTEGGPSYLTDGPVAGISQTVVASGETTVELLVVSESPWEATVVDGTFDALPTLGPVGSITGAGPAFVSADPDAVRRVVLDAEVLDQAPRLVAFDAAGSPLGEPVTLPSDLGTEVALPAGAELLLVDVRGPWTLAVAGR